MSTPLGTAYATTRLRSAVDIGVTAIGIPRRRRRVRTIPHDHPREVHESRLLTRMIGAHACQRQRDPPPARQPYARSRSRLQAMRAVDRACTRGTRSAQSDALLGASGQIPGPGEHGWGTSHASRVSRFALLMRFPGLLRWAVLGSNQRPPACKAAGMMPRRRESRRLRSIRARKTGLI